MRWLQTLVLPGKMNQKNGTAMKNEVTEWHVKAAPPEAFEEKCCGAAGEDGRVVATKVDRLWIPVEGSEGMIKHPGEDVPMYIQDAMIERGDDQVLLLMNVEGSIIVLYRG
eukprot:g14198.t1